MVFCVPKNSVPQGLNHDGCDTHACGKHTKKEQETEDTQSKRCVYLEIRVVKAAVSCCWPIFSLHSTMSQYFQLMFPTGKGKAITLGFDCVSDFCGLCLCELTQHWQPMHRLMAGEKIFKERSIHRSISCLNFSIPKCVNLQVPSLHKKWTQWCPGGCMWYGRQTSLEMHFRIHLSPSP